jgi:hypothetical protein
MNERAIARFWSKVAKGDGCWEWQGGRNDAGYGIFYPTSDNRSLAHRVCWEICNGEIPEGLCVLHRCDNPPCCNPAHHFLGTKGENNADKIAKGRQARGEQVGGSALTESDVLRARQLSASGMSTRRIATLFAVDGVTIHQAVTGRSWAHVPGAIEPGATLTTTCGDCGAPFSWQRVKGYRMFCDGCRRARRLAGKRSAHARSGVRLEAEADSHA